MLGSTRSSTSRWPSGRGADGGPRQPGRPGRRRRRGDRDLRVGPGRGLGDRVPIRVDGERVHRWSPPSSGTRRTCTATLVPRALAGARADWAVPTSSSSTPAPPISTRCWRDRRDRAHRDAWIDQVDEQTPPATRSACGCCSARRPLRRDRDHERRPHRCRSGAPSCARSPSWARDRPAAAPYRPVGGGPRRAGPSWSGCRDRVRGWLICIRDHPRRRRRGMTVPWLPLGAIVAVCLGLTLRRHWWGRRFPAGLTGHRHRSRTSSSLHRPAPSSTGTRLVATCCSDRSRHQKRLRNRLIAATSVSRPETTDRRHRTRSRSPSPASREPLAQRPQRRRQPGESTTSKVTDRGEAPGVPVRVPGAGEQPRAVALGGLEPRQAARHPATHPLRRRRRAPRRRTASPARAAPSTAARASRSAGGVKVLGSRARSVTWSTQHPPGVAAARPAQQVPAAAGARPPTAPRPSPRWVAETVRQAQQPPGSRRPRATGRGARGRRRRQWSQGPAARSWDRRRDPLGHPEDLRQRPTHDVGRVGGAAVPLERGPSPGRPPRRR